MKKRVALGYQPALPNQPQRKLDQPGVLAWELITPKDGLPAETFGLPNCTRLNRLKNSVRNCSPIRSVMDVVLKTAKSQLLMPWLRSVGSSRLSLPNVNAGGEEKQAVLNHWASLACAAPPGDLAQPAT